MVTGNTEMVDVGDVTNSTFSFTKTCNSSGEDYFLTLMHSNSESAIIQVNASVSSSAIPDGNTIKDAYNCNYCSSATDCGNYFTGSDQVSFNIPNEYSQN